MRFVLLEASDLSDERAVLHVEPRTDKERETLEKLLRKHPSVVAGFGRDAGTGNVIHMQLVIPD